MRLVPAACSRQPELSGNLWVSDAQTDLDTWLVGETTLQLHQRSTDFVTKARLATMVRRSPCSCRPMGASPGVVAMATGCHGATTTMSMMPRAMRVGLGLLRHGMCPCDGVCGFGLCDFGAVTMSKPRQKAWLGCASCCLCCRTGHDEDVSGVNWESCT